MSGKIRFAAIMLAVIILLFSLTAAVSVFHKHSDNCMGDGCPICEFLSVCEKISSVAVCALISIITPSLTKKVSGFSVNERARVFITPVSLKVKMTD